MSMHNLIEYSDHYADSSGSLYQFKRDESQLTGFNATSENNDMINFINNQCLSHLIKGPTCFKSANESMIDLFLTTNTYLFQKTNSF